jgi:hypothetical protein
MKAGELLNIIDEIQEKEMVSLTDIATAANLSRSHFSTVLNGDAKKDVSNSMLRKLKKKYPKYFPDDESNKPDKKQKIPPLGPLKGAVVRSETSEDPVGVALLKLADANQRLSRSHEKLVDMLAIERTIAGESSQMFEAVRAKLSAIHDVVLDTAVKAKYFPSKEAGIEVLNTKTAEFLKNK